MKDKILVDTNILVYLIDETEEEKHLQALDFFKKIQNKENYFVAFQNLKEFSNIARKKAFLSAKEINEKIHVFADSFKMVFDDYQDLENANELVEKTKAPFWDSMIVAVMQKEKITKILTENVKDFEKFESEKIEIINLFK